MQAAQEVTAKHHLDPAGASQAHGLKALKRHKAKQSSPCCTTNRPSKPMGMMPPVGPAPPTPTDTAVAARSAAENYSSEWKVWWQGRLDRGAASVGQTSAVLLPFETFTAQRTPALIKWYRDAMCSTGGAGLNHHHTAWNDNQEHLVSACRCSSASVSYSPQRVQLCPCRVGDSWAARHGLLMREWRQLHQDSPSKRP